MFHGKIIEVEGKKKLQLNAPALYNHHISKMPVGKEVTVYVELHKRKRSTYQNRYLWGVVYALIAETTGYSVNEVHTWAKRKFLPVKDIRIGNVVVKDSKSTTDLGVGEMVEYTEAIRSFAESTLDCHIPTPLEAGFDRNEAYEK
jgi:hypothetical protein